MTKKTKKEDCNYCYSTGRVWDSHCFRCDLNGEGEWIECHICSGKGYTTKSKIKRKVK